MKTIYKKDLKGKIRFIEYSTEGNKLIQKSGVLGSENIVENIRECKAKNIGKSNETTPAEQAIKQMNSKIKDKLEGQYFETEEEAMNSFVLGPMLAKDYFKHPGKVGYPAYVQPKLDGQRCIAIKKNGAVEKLMSRDYKTIISPHIEKQLNHQSVPDGIYDGELYIHGKTFQEVISIIKNEDVDANLEYHIYDIVNDNIFEDRLKYLKTLDFLKQSQSKLKLVPGLMLRSSEYLRTVHAQFFNAGYEGIMIRNLKSKYKIDSRSFDLLKYKKFITIDAFIEDVIPYESNPEMGTPVCTYIHEDTGLKVRFKTGCKLPHEMRKDLLKNKESYIGKIANIRFFEWTDENKPRFPVLIGFHEDR